MRVVSCNPQASRRLLRLLNHYLYLEHSIDGRNRGPRNSYVEYKHMVSELVSSHRVAIRRLVNKRSRSNGYFQFNLIRYVVQYVHAILGQIMTLSVGPCCHLVTGFLVCDAANIQINLLDAE